MHIFRTKKTCTFFCAKNVIFCAHFPRQKRKREKENSLKSFGRLFNYTIKITTKEGKDNPTPTLTKRIIMAEEDDNCNICKKLLTYADMAVFHDKCEHYACAGTCSDGSNDWCDACIEKKNFPSIGEIVVTDTQQNLPEEIQTYTKGLFSGTMRNLNKVSAILNWGKRDLATCNDVYWLIDGKVPIKELISRKIGINSIIKAGVNLSMLISNGYTIEDLNMFPEVTPCSLFGKTKPHGIVVLEALGVRPHHFRGNHKSFPFEQVCQLTGLNKTYLSAEMGLRFDSIEGIVSPDDPESWTVDDLYALGFTNMRKDVMN